MIIHHQNNVAAFAGNHIWYWVGQPFFGWRISVTTAAAAGRIMASLASSGGLVYRGGIAGRGGGLAA